jgi:hypothetical protein
VVHRGETVHCEQCGRRITGKAYTPAHGEFCSLTCADELLAQDVATRRASLSSLDGLFRVYNSAHEPIGYATSVEEAQARRGSCYVASNAGHGPLAWLRVGRIWEAA